jgi:hypothetical protein
LELSYTCVFIWGHDGYRIQTIDFWLDDLDYVESSLGIPPSNTVVRAVEVSAAQQAFTRVTIEVKVGVPG